MPLPSAPMPPWRKPRYNKDVAKHVWLDDARKEWMIEIPNKGTTMFLYHYPDPEGPWKCDSNGMWLTTNRDGALLTSVCNCRVIIPTKIQKKLAFLVAARYGLITLGG